MLSCFSLPRTSLSEGKRFLDYYAMETRPMAGQVCTREHRLSRLRKFLALLGNPQEACKVIHIAGTTGKGSTCHFIEAILRSHGFKTGLCISPHALDVRERFQINVSLLDEEGFLRVLNEIAVAARTFFVQEQDWPSYCELVRAMTFLVFAQEQVDYAVVETGIGGLFDSSNVVEQSDKFCVITKLGFDHVKTLGSKIEEIATHKLGIIHPGNEVVIAAQEAIEQTTLVKMAELVGAKRVWCASDVRLSIATTSSVPYLAQNAETSVLTCQRVAIRDGWALDDVGATRAVRETHIPLRFEQLPWRGKTLIFDVAHNPQKMEGLAQALRGTFPLEPLAVAVAFNPGTDISKTLVPLYSITKCFACADFIGGQGEYGFRFVDPVSVAALIQEAQPERETPVLPEWDIFLRWLKTTSEQVIVITGSFHFVASTYAKLVEEPTTK